MIRLCGRLQPSVRMAVIYDNKVLLHTFTGCICIYQPTLRRPLNFVSQYLQRYTGFSASVSVKIWSSPCSTEVMHRGFLQRITFRISFGRERGLFSTIFSFLIIFTVILWSINPRMSKSRASIGHSTMINLQAHAGLNMV